MTVRLVLRGRHVSWIDEAALTAIRSLCQELGLPTHFDGRGRTLLVDACLQGKTIVIDPVPGPEESRVLEAARRAGRLLAAAGARVVLTREEGTERGISERSRVARKAHPDAVIGIAAAGRARRLTATYPLGSLRRSRRLAHALLQGLACSAGTAGGSARPLWADIDDERRGILAATGSPCVLLDSGHASPPDGWARGIYHGLVRYFGGSDAEAAFLPVGAGKQAREATGGRSTDAEGSPAGKAVQVLPPAQPAGVRIAVAKVRTDWFNPPGGGESHVFRPGGGGPVPSPLGPGWSRVGGAPAPPPVQSDVHRFP